MRKAFLKSLRRKCQPLEGAIARASRIVVIFAIGQMFPHNPHHTLIDYQVLLIVPYINQLSHQIVA